MKFNVFWIAVIVWIGVIFYFTSRPADVSRRQSGEMLVKADIIKESEVNTSVASNKRESYVLKAQNMIRKSAHVIEYFILGIFTAMAVTYKQRLKIFNIALSFIFCLAIASLDEFIQKFVPGRGSLLSDVKIDGIGFCTGITLIIVLKLIIMYVGKYKNDKKISVNG